MSEDEIRERVRSLLTKGLLPRDLPKLVHRQAPGQPRETLMETGGALNDRCIVCHEIATQIRYALAEKAVAFHRRCHDIWKEEAMRPPVDSGATGAGSTGGDV
jgi:hypothetical protein